MSKTTFVAEAMLALLAALPPNLAAAQPATIDGQVTKIDTSAGKITLKHGPIKKLDMDEGMTMVFRVQDPAMLKQVKVGDKVKFDADRVNGQITVTKIEKGKPVRRSFISVKRRGRSGDRSDRSQAPQ
jgi:Cu/Ag efflux protein CusF